MSSLGSIRKNIRRKQVAFDPPVEQVVGRMMNGLIDEIREMEGVTTEKVLPHARKYPQHADTEKGSVYAGVCNRTACNEVPAVFYNKGTFGYYCVPCGRAINGRDPKPLCVRVDHDLSYEEMNDFYTEAHR